MSLVYVMWYLNVRPHDSRERVRLEVFNEVLIMLCVYHMMLFSKFTTNITAQFYFGYSFLAVFGIMLVGNIARVLKISVHNWKVNRYKKICA